jgi:hypothetical protein
MPDGKLKRAAVPVASKKPGAGCPASVETLPFGSMRRIVLLSSSVTYTTFWLSTVMPHGRANREATDEPSV